MTADILRTTGPGNVWGLWVSAGAYVGASEAACRQGPQLVLGKSESLRVLSLWGCIHWVPSNAACSIVSDQSDRSQLDGRCGDERELLGKFSFDLIDISSFSCLAGAQLNVSEPLTTKQTSVLINQNSKIVFTSTLNRALDYQTRDVPWRIIQ